MCESDCMCAYLWYLLLYSLIMSLCAFGPARLMLAVYIHSVSPLWESRVKKREELAQ